MKQLAPLSNQDLDFFFEAHHHVLATHLESVGHAFLAEEDKPHDLAYSAGVAKELGAKHGLYQWLVPESGKVDLRALCLIREMLGYACPLADAIFAVQGLGSYPIVLAGSEQQRQEFLPKIKTGELIGAFALTEAEAGSDVASMQCSAERNGTGWRLNGTKIFISNVGIADFYTLFAVTGSQGKRAEISAFIVPADAPGLSTEKQPLSVDHPIGKVHLNDCHLPASAMLGAQGEGFKLAMRTLDGFRASVGAASVGMGRRALVEALAHVQQRVQFKKALSEQQQVQAYLADMATELDAARLLVLRAARAKDTSNERHTKAVSMAKMYGTEAAQQIIDKAVQLFGGKGVSLGNVAERLYREIRPLRIYEGTTEIQRVIIANELFKGA
jgi:acyl-CoA dehydrogenase